MRLWLMFLFSLLAFGCSKEGKLCPDDKNCGDELLCEPVTNVCQSICGKSADCGKGLDCDKKRGVCFSLRERRQAKRDRLKRIEQARKDEACQQSEDCKHYGMCATVNDRCTATKDADCRESEMCKIFGRCTAVNGECTVAKDEDCRQSDSCKMFGRCTAVDGECKKR